MKSTLYQHQKEESIALFNKLLVNSTSLKEYIDTLNKLYKIQITDYDIIKISSIILDNPPKIVILKTNIFVDVTKQELINNQFKYTYKYHKLNIKIAYTNNNIINPTHIYTYTEIINLINNNQIILLEFILNVEEDNLYYDDFEYRELYPLYNITYNNFTNTKYIAKKYIPYIKKYLNIYFTKEKLQKDKIKIKRISK